MALELNIVIPDSHVPHHNHRAFKLLHQIIRFLRDKYGDDVVKRLILLGDFADVYFCNSHGKHPELFATLKEEVEAVNAELDKFDEMLPNTQKIYIEGNHEHRLERFILNKAPELFGITSIDHLFKMHERPLWTWIDYKATQLYRIGKSSLHVRHEPIATNAKLSSQRAKVSFIHGHTHRVEAASTVGLDGVETTVASPGWLGDSRKDLVFGYCRPEWQLGFATVWTDSEVPWFFYQSHRFAEDEDRLAAFVEGAFFAL